MTKTSQGNNGIITSIKSTLLKYFYEYITEKLKYQDVTRIILNLST